MIAFFGSIWKELASLASLVVILTFLKKPAGWLVGWLRCNLRADHATLVAGSQREDNARGPQGFIHVVIAPSWRLRRHLGRPLDARAVDTWVTEAVGDVSAAEPAEYRNPGELIRYRYGPMDCDTWVWVYRVGRLDLTIPVAIDVASGRRLLALENVVRPLWLVARSVEGGAYEELFGRGLRRRRRLDWRVGVSTYILDANRCLVAIDDFAFPGRRPGPKPPAMLLNGIPSPAALRGLECRASSTDTRRLIHLALGPILTASGYDDCAPAIDDALDIVARETAPASIAAIKGAP